MEAKHTPEQDLTLDAYTAIRQDCDHEHEACAVCPIRLECDDAITATTEAKHTPGPWRKSDTVYLGSSTRVVAVRIANEHGNIFTIDRATNEDGGYALGSDQMREVASLVAASPMMLDALKDALPYIAAEGEAGDTHADDVADRIRAAVGKAEGR